MRQFFRTAAGKTILFLLCGIFGVIFTATVAGSVVLVEQDFYTREESDLREEVFDGLLYRDGQSLVWRAENDMLSEEEDGETGNLTWQIVGTDGKVKAGKKDTKIKWQYTRYYMVYEDGDDIWNYQLYESPVKHNPSQKYATIHFNIDASMAKPDKYAWAEKGVHMAYKLRYTIYVIMALAFVLGLLSFVTLMGVSGRRRDTGEICPGPLYAIPADLLTWILGMLACAAIGIPAGMMTDSWIVNAVFLGVGVLLAGNIFLGFCMSIAVRVKKKTLWKNTVIYWCLHLMKKICVGIWAMLLEFPMIWKVVLGAGILSFLEFLGIVAFSYDTGILMMLWFLEKLILLPVIFYGAWMIRRLQKGAAVLAEGDLSYQIDTKGMRGDFKKQGEDLNSIASGMSLAVEKQLKSERMKTELITNVSHDIKTPLTSIINYADLIGKESCENEKITEYAEVLVRQSVRLKRLIEDLVEASKASTGNLEVNLAACDAAVFLTQAGGEYEEKLQNANLTLVTSQPENEIRIMADGRRMWRVFDNLMNNICKYAQPGTRVYLSLERIGNSAVIIFRNTSREALNISEEELMERFVRGDASRTTEGNGLGLSIARSLAELQGGKLTIKIDGDLFKAILTFPVLNER